MTTLRGYISTMNKPKKIIDLPVELIVQILQMVDARDIINISHVSRALYEICTGFDWCQLYIPPQIQYVATPIRFKNISFLECKIQLPDLMMLRNVETIFFYDIDIKDIASGGLVFEHLLNIGCKNIVFYQMCDIHIIHKYFLPQINYYYHTQMEHLRLTDSVTKYLINHGICYNQYCKETHYEIFKNLSFFQKISKNNNISSNMNNNINSNMHHTYNTINNFENHCNMYYNMQRFVFDPSRELWLHHDIFSTITDSISNRTEKRKLINNDKKYISRYDKSLLRQKITHDKMQQNHKQTKSLFRQKMHDKMYPNYVL